MRGLFQKKLPHCDELFVKYLSPYYDEDERPDMTRPDMYVIAGFQGEKLDLLQLQYLPDELLDWSKGQIDLLLEMALEDYQGITGLDKIDLNTLDVVDKYYDRKKIAALIKESSPDDPYNPYLLSVCKFGAVLGHLFNQIEGFGWLYSVPSFHSIIVHSETGWGITVFDWAVKKFSEYGVDDGFAAKFKVAVEGASKPPNH